MLVDVPYDIMGIKLLWWTWHDTDTNMPVLPRALDLVLFFTSFGCTFVFLQQRLQRLHRSIWSVRRHDIDAMPPERSSSRRTAR